MNIQRVKIVVEGLTLGQGDLCFCSMLRCATLASRRCVPEMSEHDANTIAVILASKAMNHQEGGWPKDIDYTEAEHTIRCAGH